MERDERFQRWKADYDMARIDIERIEAIGGLSDTGKIALAATPNAQALTQLMKTQAHADMTPEQLQALASVVAAENSVSPAEAMRLAQQSAQDERAHNNAQQDKDRAHQLELLKLQNATHANALAAQMQLGVGVAQAGAPVHHHHAPAQPGVLCCVNGHPVPADRPDARFCAECGVPLSR
jgi:hypothetical protein